MAKQELTLKQRKFIKFYIKTGNLAEACEKAGYQTKDRESLTVIGCQNLAKLRGKIAAIMDEMGLDNVNLLKKLDEGLDSMVVKTASDKGFITDEKIYVDFPTRAKYLEMGFKLTGGFAPEKKEVTGKGGGPIETKTEFDLAKRLINNESANKLIHALLDLAGNPGGNGGETESGPVGTGKTPNPS